MMKSHFHSIGTKRIKSKEDMNEATFRDSDNYYTKTFTFMISYGSSELQILREIVREGFNCKKTVPRLLAIPNMSTSS